jgi:hypothetical protein
MPHAVVWRPGSGAILDSKFAVGIRGDTEANVRSSAPVIETLRRLRERVAGIEQHREQGSRRESFWPRQPSNIPFD